ncbi:MAG: histone deacetylase, partial [Planctomycetota bacterium]
HDTGQHPETAMRLSNTMAYLKRKKWFYPVRSIDANTLIKSTTSNNTSNGASRVTLLEPRQASVDEIAYIHSREYIESLKAVTEQGGGYLDGDTPVSEKSYEVALYAAGGVLTAVDKVIATPKSNALCLVRPPGHHAMPTHGMGFCLFNNVAIAARYAQNQHGLKKIAIIDWDLHHGNGTQEAFWKDDTVLFCSLHRYPYYPGSGSGQEKGVGPGAGFTINIPLAGYDSNKEYLDKFARLMTDVVRPYKPDFIFISAGFDSYKNDPLGGLGMEISDYGELTKMVRAVADETCQGRIVSALEGGYNIQELPLCIESHLAALVS